jgi:hypothetical protein
VTEDEWEATDSLWGVTGPDLIGLFETGHRKFFAFLATFLPQWLPANGCGLCRASLRLFEEQVDRGWASEDWGSVVRSAHHLPGPGPPANWCESRQWFRNTRLYLAETSPGSNGGTNCCKQRPISIGTFSISSLLTVIGKDFWLVANTSRLCFEMAGGP